MTDTVAIWQSQFGASRFIFRAVGGRGAAVIDSAIKSSKKKTITNNYVRPDNTNTYAGRKIIIKH